MREREKYFFFLLSCPPHFFPHYYYCHLVAFPDIRRIESPIPPFLIEWKIKVTRSMKNIASRDHTLHPRLYLILFHLFFFFSFWADLFLFYLLLLLSSIILFFFFFLFGALSLYSCYVCVCHSCRSALLSLLSSLEQALFFLFFFVSFLCVVREFVWKYNPRPPLSSPWYYIVVVCGTDPHHTLTHKILRSLDVILLMKKKGIFTHTHTKKNRINFLPPK